MMRGRLRSVALAACVAMTASATMADALIFKDGRVLNGRLIRRTESEIVFEIHRGTRKMTATFPAKDVRRVIVAKTPTSKPVVPDKPPATRPAAPLCFVIPLRGTLGLEINEEILQKCLNIAKVRRAAIVVLEIDSDGGSVAALKRMVRLIQTHKKLRFAAYVRRATSVAAILAMSCPQIVVAPDGAIGAVGAPGGIDAKAESIFRAWCRSQAERVGHDPLFVEAMIRQELVLRLLETDKGPKLTTGDAGRKIKDAGRILTLTGKQATEFGLAVGTAESVGGGRELLGFKKWRVDSRRAGTLMKGWAAKLKDAARRYDVSFKKAQALRDRARATDPVDFDYETDMWGEFTKDARKKWRQRSDKCAKLLAAAEASLAKAAALSGRYRQLFEFDLVKHSKEQIDQIKKEVADLRRKIEADRKKKSVAWDE